MFYSVKYDPFAPKHTYTRATLAIVFVALTMALAVACGQEPVPTPTPTNCRADPDRDADSAHQHTGSGSGRRLQHTDAYKGACAAPNSGANLYTMADPNTRVT